MKNSRQPRPPNQTARKRFRGRLFIALHQDEPGDDKPIQSMHVCVDFFTACLMISKSPGGDILVAKPSEGRAFRDFLAGGEPPFPIPTARHPEKLVGRVADASDNSKTLARTAIDCVLRESVGAGADIYRAHYPVPKVDHKCAN